MLASQIRNLSLALISSWIAAAHAQISGSSASFNFSQLLSDAADSRLKIAEMETSVQVESALAPSYVALAVRSKDAVPSLSQTRVGGLSVSELKLEKPYEKKDAAEVRHTVEETYANAPKAVQDQLIDIFLDADQRLFDVQQHLKSLNNDVPLMLKYAYPRAQVVQQLFTFEVNARLAKPDQLPRIVNEFDEKLDMIMIRGSSQ